MLAFAFDDQHCFILANLRLHLSIGVCIFLLAFAFVDWRLRFALNCISVQCPAVLNSLCLTGKACSKRRTYHVPNLIQGVKYMISSTFATIKFGDFN